MAIQVEKPFIWLILLNSMLYQHIQVPENVDILSALFIDYSLIIWYN